MEGVARVRQHVCQGRFRASAPVRHIQWQFQERPCQGLLRGHSQHASLETGLTKVVSTATCAPCHSAPCRSPAATTRRSSVVYESFWQTTRRRYGMPSPPKGRNCRCTSAGLGLRSAETPRMAAHWAAWAGTLPTLRGRHPVVVEGLLSQAASQRRGEGSLLPCVAAATSSRFCLQRAGFDAPTWHQLIDIAAHDPLRVWQRAATASLDAACESLLSDLDPASRALLLSQAGPGGSRATTALPTSPELRMPSECTRVVLLRRLKLLLPHAPRPCRCGGSPWEPPGRLPCGGRCGSARCTFGTGRRPDLPGSWGACRNQRFAARHERGCPAGGFPPH